MPNQRRMIHRRSDRIFDPLHTVPYEPRPEDPSCRPLQIYTQDPGHVGEEFATTTVEVPYEPLEPGPKGAVLLVDDSALDPRQPSPLNPPLDLEAPEQLIQQGLNPTTTNPQFAQQMCYAVANMTFTAFRKALGRSPSWTSNCIDFESKYRRLRLRPHAFHRANAYYDGCGVVNFGHFKSAATYGTVQQGQTVCTSLSHDVIVHEVTHALLDGMRSHFTEGTQVEVFAFHEAFADTIAILQHFTYMPLLEAGIRKSAGSLSSDLLMTLATQFGHTSPEAALRSGLDIAEGNDRLTYAKAVAEPDASKRRYTVARVLVVAIFDAFRDIFERKTGDVMAMLNVNKLSELEYLNPSVVSLLARRASRLASQLQRMCIRAVDYCPPVDLEFGEFLRALITADRDLIPDDPLGYRTSLVRAFRDRGIRVPDVDDLSEEALLWLPPPQNVVAIEGLRFSKIRFSDLPPNPSNREELERQADALGVYVTEPARASAFGLEVEVATHHPPEDYSLPEVQSIRTVGRIGPDGQIKLDIVAEVTQKHLPSGLVGGSTIIVGPDGHLRYVIVKRVGDRVRQSLQMANRSLLGENAEGKSLWEWMHEA